jgi:hypothetical protein
MQVEPPARVSRPHRDHTAAAGRWGPELELPVRAEVDAELARVTGELVEQERPLTNTRSSIGRSTHSERGLPCRAEFERLRRLD